MSTLCRDYPSAVSINRFEPNGQTDWVSDRHRGGKGSVLPGCRLSNQYPPINSPAAPCCTPRTRRDAHCTLFSSPVFRHHVASCSRRAHHQEQRRHAILIALVALPGATLLATSCLGAFWTPPVFRYCRRPKTSTGPEIANLFVPKYPNQSDIGSEGIFPV